MSLHSPSIMTRPDNRAFTLVEMIITLTIFVLLSGSVFGIITAVLRTSSNLRDNQNHTDEMMAFESVLARDLRELPGASLFQSYRRGSGEGLDQDGIIFGTDNELSAIDAKLQPNGLYTVRLATFRSTGENIDAPTVFTQLVTADDPSLNWIDLLHDVSHVDWKFQASDQTDWALIWNIPGTKPNFVQLSLQLGGDLRATLMDFWIPQIAAPPGQSIPPPLHPANAS